MDEFVYYSAIKLSQMIRDGEISSFELLEMYLSRIEKFNEGINAVVTLDVDRARKKARQADELLSKGELLGPLHGIPVTIKDAFETAGLRTTSGASKLKEYIPSTTAVAVQRYMDAGAIVFGKTNVPIFCGDLQTYNDLFGVTNNPWDLARSPGGSSGGATSVLAAGLTGLELGSDIAGSIRTPANWTGVYGHKSSYGIIPQRGHIPPPSEKQAPRDLEVIGPLARSATDLMMALDILVGPDQNESIGWGLTLPKPRASSLQEYRIAAWLDHPYMPVDNQVKECHQVVVETLQQAGAMVDDQARPEIETAEAFRTYQQLMHPVMAAGLPNAVYEALDQLKYTEDEDSELGQFTRDVTQTHRQWLSAHAKRHQYISRWAEFFKEFDVLLCPVTSVPAIPHNIEKNQLERVVEVNSKPLPYSILQKWVGLITMVYLPATSAPVGRTPTGLPIGIQIVGPYLEDRTPIDFAEKLSEIIGGFEPPPGYE